MNENNDNAFNVFWLQSGVIPNNKSTSSMVGISSLFQLFKINGQLPATKEEGLFLGQL